MNFKKPFNVYKAATNLEAHVVVEMLVANGIEAYAVEDQFGAAIYGVGNPIYKPNVWVDQSDAEQAARVIVEFEAQRAHRDQTTSDSGESISATCDACGATSAFPASMNGSTQHCPYCRAYVDVGEIPWSSEGHAC